MKKIEQHIRQAMDKRLSALEASAQCKASIRQRIMQEEEKCSQRTVRRLPARAAVVFAVVLLIGSIAAASMVGVFALYDNLPGGGFDLIASLSQHSALKHSQPAVICDEHIGTSTASVTDGYYDGTKLFLGFTIENAGCAAAYTPSEQELASAKVREDVDFFGYTYFFAREEERALMEGFKEAVQQGKPYGAVVHRIHEDKYYTADGKILPMSWYDDYFADFSEYRIVEKGSVPEELMNLDELPIRVTLRKTTTMLYFDGSVFYVDSWEEPLDAEMTAVIPRSEKKIVRYEGSGEYRAASLQASINLSQADGTLTLSADSDLFKEYGYGRNLKFELTDAQGKSFALDHWGFPDSKTCVIYFIGNMTHPEQLNLRLYEEVHYGDYEMVPYGTATERIQVIHEAVIPLAPVP